MRVIISVGGCWRRDASLADSTGDRVRESWRITRIDYRQKIHKVDRKVSKDCYSGVVLIWRNCMQSSFVRAHTRVIVIDFTGCGHSPSDECRLLVILLHWIHRCDCNKVFSFDRSRGNSEKHFQSLNISKEKEKRNKIINLI